MNAVQTLAAEALRNPQDKPVEDVQAEFICELFAFAKDSDYNDNSSAPLLITRRNYRLPDGFCNLAEIHGYYTIKTVDKAIDLLSKKGEFSESLIIKISGNSKKALNANDFEKFRGNPTIIEMVTDEEDTDKVHIIRFITPIARLV